MPRSSLACTTDHMESMMFLALRHAVAGDRTVKSMVTIPLSGDGLV